MQKYDYSLAETAVNGVITAHQALTERVSVDSWTVKVTSALGLCHMMMENKT